MKCEIVGDFFHIGDEYTCLDNMSSMDLARWVKDHFDDDLESRLRDLFDLDSDVDVYDCVEAEHKSATEFEQAIADINEILEKLHEAN